VREIEKGTHNRERNCKTDTLCKEKRVEMLRIKGIGGGEICESLQRAS